MRLRIADHAKIDIPFIAPHDARLPAHYNTLFQNQDILMFFGQTFDPQDIAIVAFLVLLEGVLSIDNALVLGLLARRLPKHLQSKALTYGLIGAFVFRLIAIATAAFLLHWTIAKLLGGAYLLYVALKHFIWESNEQTESKVTLDSHGQPTLLDEQSNLPLTRDAAEIELQQRTLTPVATLDPTRASKKSPGFWPTVLVIELTDIAFAVDSILAAIALVAGSNAHQQMQKSGVHPKLWVILTGGFLGVILMRFAAVVFIKLLEKFPRFEVSAYLLVTVIGLKLILDWQFNTPEHHRLEFQSPASPTFWIFWAIMLACFAVGFLPKKHPPTCN